MTGSVFLTALSIVGVVAILLFRRPLNALADRLSGKAAASSDNEDTIQRVAVLEGRLAELEERLDFAERLLTKAKAQESLPGGTGA
jgi:hypothetical protein